jgi:hypothetical protein
MSRFTRPLCAALLALGHFALSAHAITLSHVGTSSSSVADAQAFEFTNEDFTQDSSVVISELMAKVGATSPDTIAKAQTLYGVNRVFASSSTAVDNEGFRQTGIGGPFALASSIWADTFTISGGQGAGQATVSATVTGQFGSGYGAAGVYVLAVVTEEQLNSIVDDPYLAELPSTILYLSQHTLAPGFEDEGERLAPGSAFGRVLTGMLPFVYDQPFMVVSLMLAGANDFGELSAMNSADFGITLPGAGASLITESGATYPLAVPEPETYALFVAGLALLTTVTRRRRA